MKKEGIQEGEIKLDGFGTDREDEILCSLSFNLLHDSNSSICNEYYDELIRFSRVLPTLTTV